VLVDYDTRSDPTGTADDDLYDALGTLPPTKVVLSRSDGSRHRLFRANGVTYTSAPTRIAGLEVKHAGGYRVGVGSVHPETGLPYVYDALTADLPLAPCPDLAPILPRWKEAEDKPAVEEQVTVGARHHALTRIAGAQRRMGLSGEEMLPTLLEVNAARCVPPLAEKDVRDIAFGVAKRYAPGETAFASSTAPTATATVVRLDTVQPRAVAWLWPGHLPRAKIVSFIGDPDLGKSFLTLDFAARISVGGKWPDGTDAPLGDVVLLTAEDGLDDTVVPRLVAMGADRGRVHALTAIREKDRERSFSLASDIEQLDQAIAAINAGGGVVRLVVIDPISAYLGAGTDSHVDASVRGVLAPVAQLAERWDCTVNTVAHLNKAQQTKALYRAGGSIAFIAAPRAVFVIGPDPDAPESPRRFFAPLKFNIAQHPPTRSFAIATDPARVVWDDPGTSSLSAATILHGAAPEDASERPARAAAADFLRQELAAGPVPVDALLKSAGKLRISERTLDRAKADAGVRARHLGGFAGDGYWVWEIDDERGRR